jgi:methylated-DNA-[protein]-cysteine S-methyltransferase
MHKEAKLYVDEMDSPLGTLTLVAHEDGLCQINFGSIDEKEEELSHWAQKHSLASKIEQNTARLQEASNQLNQYFSNERKQFNLALKFHGTPFQKKVWEALLKIPFGETRSYKDIALHINSPKAVRAIGGAVNRNPLGIIVPCHRVIGSDGSLVGYNGGLDKKEFLLQHENVLITK